MIVRWDVAALADLRAIVPEGLRDPLRQQLCRMYWPKQGLRCLDERYPDCYFVRFQTWLVMYLPVADDLIVVVGIEYNYG